MSIAVELVHLNCRPIRDGAKMFRGLMSVAYRETSLLAKTIMLPSLFFIILSGFFGIISLYEKIMFGVLEHAVLSLAHIIVYFYFNAIDFHWADHGLFD